VATSASIELEFAGRRFRRAEAGLEALAARLDRAAAVDIPAAAEKAFKQTLGDVSRAMRQRHSRPWRPGSPGPEGDRTGRLFRRTGDSIDRLARSVRVRRNGDSVEGSITPPFPLSVHETGATVRARRARFLTVPLPAALDSRGVPLRARARDWPNTFVIRSRRGNLLIVQRAAGGGIRPLFVLKREIVIPPRLGLETTINAASPGLVDRLFDEALRAFNAATAGV